MRIYRLLMVAAALLIVCPAAMAADVTYPIKFHRDSKPGDVYDTHMTCEQTQTVTVKAGDKEPQTRDQSVKGDLQGRLQVVEADAKGNSTSLTLTVRKFTDGAGKDLVEPGKVIDIKRDNKDVTFAVEGGGTLAADATNVLKMMYHPNRSEVNDDDTFGSKPPRKIGESWPIDSAMAAKDAASSGVTVDAKDLTGQVKLKGVETANGSQAPRVSASMDAKDVKPPMPTGVTLDGSQMHGQFGGLFPVDPALPPAESEMTMDMELHLSGNGVKVDSKMHVTQKEIITPATK